ncbi:hypothetical protein DBV15_07708 [Temnothorax longispinosus]|uniref:Uncharacterized protein n=1 Tax=Temnothorax longispinosus TaxID=300112 RepID=A0A4S2KR21_9HYME|nr:hypothetical protein DBV15_07708 [Temnothorax longispinosus]
MPGHPTPDRALTVVATCYDCALIPLSASAEAFRTGLRFRFPLIMQPDRDNASLRSSTERERKILRRARDPIASRDRRLNPRGGKEGRGDRGSRGRSTPVLDKKFRKNEKSGISARLIGDTRPGKSETELHETSACVVAPTHFRPPDAPPRFVIIAATGGEGKESPRNLNSPSFFETSRTNRTRSRFQ